jgi:ferritin-like metal-binding protein YciE
MKQGIDLFEHELKDVYDAEHKLSRELENMAKKATDEQLVEGFVHHKQETDGQIKRLEDVFGIVGKNPSRETCHGINGLIEEYKTFVQEEDPSPELLDVFSTGAALKVEHYEIASYSSLIKLANQAGLRDAASLLKENLIEEQDTAKKLETLSKQLGTRV